jgi:hypothetical protein
MGCTFNDSFFYSGCGFSNSGVPQIGISGGATLGNGFQLGTGNAIRMASGVPSSGNGIDGDFYFRTDSNATYTRLSGSWVLTSPVISNTGRLTGKTSAQTTVATFTPAADGTFEVSANVNVTTSTLHNFTVTCAYTDETNTSRTLTLGFTQLSGATLLTAITNSTGVGPYESPVYHIRCKASTAITIATTGTFTTVTYNVEGAIRQLV